MRKKTSIDRHSAQRDPGCGVDRVSQRWDRGRRAGFTDTAGRLATPDEMHIDGRDLMDSQHPVVVEVRLLNPPLVERDLSMNRGGETEYQAALKLGNDGIGIDRQPAVDDGRDASQTYLTHIIDLALDNGRDETGEGGLRADTTATSCRKRCSPARFLFRPLEHALQTRSPIEVSMTKFDGIPARLTSELIHEALDGEHTVVRPDSAPEPARRAPVELAPSPSIVVIGRPLTEPTGITQERTASPEI